MVTARDIVGRSVVQADTGKVLGRVHEVLLDGQGSQVVALQIAPTSWFSAARAVPWEQVQSLGPDQVLASGEPVELPALGREARNLGQLAERSSYAVAEEATLDDVVFEPDSGQVLGYRLSGGFLQDLLDGRSFLPAGQVDLSGDL
ncbi:MAG: PRC-barrel domain-containing protein [Firmicutes bacterium]|nr:PRC-barrel domain-containing protein [Bacillota bacterium]